MDAEKPSQEAHSDLGLRTKSKRKKSTTKRIADCEPTASPDTKRLRPPKEKEYKCESCGAIYFAEHRLQAHLYEVHGIETFQCTECDETLPTEILFRYHMTTHSTEIHECSICCLQLPSLEALTEHEATHDVGSVLNLRDEGVTKFPADGKKGGSSDEVANSSSGESKKKKAPEDTSKKTFVTGELETSRYQRFNCQLCNLKFRTKFALSAHIYTHTDGKVHKCGRCQKSFNSTYLLDVHEKTHNKAQMGHQCGECGKKFTSDHFLKKHMEYHVGGSTSYKCQYCTMVFTSKSYWREHEVSHLKEAVNYFRCMLCSQKFITKKDLSQHLLTHTDVRWHRCKQCPRSFKSAHLLALHEKNHAEAALKCKKCAKVFSSKGLLENHVQSEHVEKGVSNRCRYCKMVFATQTQLREHEDSHRTKTMFRCELCFFNFLHMNSVVRHLKTKRHVSNLKDAFAEGTELVTKTSEYPPGIILIDVKEIEEDPRFTCKFCGVVFNVAQKLRHHQHKDHRMELGLYCSECDKTFPTESILKCHMTLHSGSLHKCGQCGYILTNAAALRDHQEKHGSKLKCSKCDQLFPSEYARDQHYLQVHKENAFLSLSVQSTAKGSGPSSSRLPGQQAETAVGACEEEGDEDSDESNS